MHRYKFFRTVTVKILFLVILVSSHQGQAQIPESYTVTDALAYAQAENPSLQAALKRYEAAKERVPQASALPDPRLQITHFVESIETRTGPQQDAVSLSQTFPWFGKRKAQADVATAGAEAMFYAYQTMERELFRQIGGLLYEYAYTGKSLELVEQNILLLRQLLPVVEARVQGGGELNALLLLQVEIGKLDDRWQTLKRKRKEQSAQLHALIGSGGQDLLPWPATQAPDIMEIVPVSLMRSLEDYPALKISDERIAQAVAKERLARLENYPDFTLGVNYIRTSDAVVPTLPDSGRDPWAVMFSVNIPLWFEKNDAARQEAILTQSAERHAKENTHKMLRADLTSVIAKHKDAQRRLLLFRDELLPLARQALEISRTAYETDKVSILEVIESERSLIELELLYWRAAADAQQSRIALQTLTNTKSLNLSN